MYYFKETLQQEIEHIKFLIHSMESLSFPHYSGTMVCKFTGGQFRYYRQLINKQTQKRTQQPIGTSENIEVINRKKIKYIKTLLKKLNTNLILLETVYPKFQEYEPEKIIEQMSSSYRDIDEVNYPTNNQDNQTKPTLNFKSENINYPLKNTANITVTGQYVRSKGEVIIYNLLTSYGIPFIYEHAIKLETKEGQIVTRYPDFEIKLTRPLYWEHFGYLDDGNYSESVRNKLQLYHRNRITIGDNLILTSDRIDGTINSQMIDEIIRNIILPKLK